MHKQISAIGLDSINLEKDYNIFVTNTRIALKKLHEELIEFLKKELDCAYKQQKEELYKNLQHKVNKLESNTGQILFIHFITKECSEPMFIDIFERFKIHIQKTQIDTIFGNEKYIAKKMKTLPGDIKALQTIYSLFETEFLKTRGNDFVKARVNFKVDFLFNLEESFGKYNYFHWERYVLKLKKEKPITFPCFNEILTQLEEWKKEYIIREVFMLQKCKIL